jgi:hypothetical protein
MLYRMRVYRAVPENLALFHDFFRTHLLPVQLRHGAPAGSVAGAGRFAMGAPGAEEKYAPYGPPARLPISRGHR